MTTSWDKKAKENRAIKEEARKTLNENTKQLALSHAIEEMQYRDVRPEGGVILHWLPPEHSFAEIVEYIEAKLNQDLSWWQGTGRLTRVIILHNIGCEPDVIDFEN